MAYENLRTLDLNLLLILNTALEEKHISKAAEKLGLTQSAVSHALSRLRHYFNDPLLIKDGHNMTLSDFATQIKPNLEKVLHQISSLTTHVSNFDPQSTSHEFTIGLPEYIAIALLERLNNALMKQAPNIKIKTINVNSRDGTTVLENGEADIIIGRFSKTAKVYEQKFLFREDYVCIMEKNHQFIYNKKISLKNYMRAAHMHISLTNRNYGYFDQCIKTESLKRNIQMTLSNYMLGLVMVEKNDLILSEPRHTVTPLSKKLNVAILELPFQSPQFDVSALWHRRDSFNPAHQWLRKQIENIAKDL